MKPLTRRRFMSVCAMAGACAAMPWAGALASAPLHRWNGILLGADVSLTLAHPSGTEASRIFKRCVREIKRLENIFTLYDSHSELSRLNENGVLQAPSPEMIDILKQARTYHAITGGAFDVTVKPLERGPEHLHLVGMDKLEIGKNEIRFTQPGMGITLNGIAQGYITDRITELLKAEGLNNVLVELGEKRSIGGHPQGRPWQLAVEGQETPVSLTNKAMATSAALSPNTNAHHIFKPRDGRFANAHQNVSVIAETAAMADALSTGFLSMDEKAVRKVHSREKALSAVYLTKPFPYTQIAVINRST